MHHSLRSALATTFVAVGLSLVACQSSTPQPLSQNAPRALGTLEVHLDALDKTARATFEPLPTSGVRPQVVLDETQFTITPSSFQVVQTASRRLFNARFDIKNASAATVNNLTLVAYVKNGNQAQSAIKNAQNFVGAGLDLDAFVQDVRPAHGVNNDASVNSSLADLMLFSEPETSSLQSEALTANALQSGEYLLPYGYVARNASDARSIAVDANTATGAVNIGLNVPANNDPSNAAYRFSMTFVVFENPTPATRVTQSLEEQSSDATVDARVTQTGATEVVVLQGSSYPTSAQTVKVLCDVRTAGTAAAPSAVLVASNTLAIGQALNLSGSSAGTQCLKHGSGTGEYIAIPTNLDPSVSRSLSTKVSNMTTATVTTYAATPGLTPQALQTSSATAQGLPMRENLDALLSRPDSRVRSRVRAQALGVRPQGITPGVPTVGTQMSLNVATGCSGAVDLRTGTVKAVSDHLIVIADDANPPGGFTDAQYGLIATTGGTGTGDPTYGFDEDAYDAIVDAFGAPADVDNNGRIIAFYTRAVNELSPPASSVATLGYFTNRDMFSAGSCARSNEGEILYMMVPDPTGVVNSNVRTVSFVAGSTTRTLGAEFQRLVNASRRTYVTNAANFEETWLDEGLSYAAEELMFYQNSVGLAPLGNIIVTSLTTGPNASRRVAAFNTFANLNFGRWRSALQRPDIRSPLAGVTQGATDQDGRRGALWSFLRYAADRKISSGSQNAFWASLVDTNLTGRANLQNAIGADLNTWLRDWSGAIYADDAVVGVGSEFTAASWNYRSLYIALNISYQLLLRTLVNDINLTLSYVAGGSSHNRFAIADSTTATVLLRSGGAAPPSSVALTLMRVR